jgi:hypothetical protein
MMGSFSNEATRPGSLDSHLFGFAGGDEFGKLLRRSPKMWRRPNEPHNEAT